MKTNGIRRYVTAGVLMTFAICYQNCGGFSASNAVQETANDSATHYSNGLTGNSNASTDPGAMNSVMQDWPDLIECTTASSEYLLLPIWQYEASGIVLYGTATNYVEFDHKSKKISGIQAGSEVLSKSNCVAGTKLENLTSQILPKTAASLIPDAPDYIVCSGQKKTFMALPNWMRDSQGNISYGSPDANVVVGSNGVISTVTGGFNTLITSTCAPGTALSAITSFNVLRLGGGSLVEGMPDILVCQSSDSRYAILWNYSKSQATGTEFGGIETNIAFGEQLLIDAVNGALDPLTSSDCRLGNSIKNISAIRLYD